MATILIVEDERIVARDLARRLEGAGYGVVGTVATGEDALRLAERSPFDLALMDVSLQGKLDGIQTAELLKTTFGVSVVYLTAHSDEATFRRLLETDPLGYLVKPFDERLLLTTVEMALYRSRIEKELRQSREELERFFDLSLDMLCIADERGKFVRHNRAWRQLGYSNSDLIGRTISDYVHPDDRAAMDDGTVVARNGDRDKTRLESRFRCADGEYRWLVWNVCAVREQGLIYASAHDVTELREQHGQAVALSSRLAEGLMHRKRDLERSNAELRQFAYVASHVLKEPLRTISFHIQWMERQLCDVLTPDTQTAMGYVTDAAQRMHGMIDALLDYTELNAGELHLQPTDCNSTADSAFAELSSEIAATNALVTRGDLPTVVADGLMLRRVFCGLLKNALTFHLHTSVPGHGEIPPSTNDWTDGLTVASRSTPPKVHLSAVREGDFWVFSVRDNGIGIRSEHFERIFQIFQRLHHADEFPGTGIGLSLCKRIIERHGGTIWVESSPDVGSTFSFSLPVDEPLYS